MKASEIQTKILTETGLKTSVKKYSKGSMKGYVRIMPIFQNGSYPSLPFDFVQKLKAELSGFDYSNKPVFCTCSDICVYQIEDDRIQMKKESKPKEIDHNKTMKGWGSKNSQMRLDKASARNAKKMKNGGVARFY
ncbi:MAG: hypothetical protein EKK64_07915 [Neisseriaceae bacterium]|nr:MAG: hypothetical protein EKK64_07915 [Neisseriaceae bacterium]